MTIEEKISALLEQQEETSSSPSDNLAAKERLDRLESDIVILKTAVKMLSQEVAELKKAQ